MAADADLFLELLRVEFIRYKLADLLLVASLGCISASPASLFQLLLRALNVDLVSIRHGKLGQSLKFGVKVIKLLAVERSGLNEFFDVALAVACKFGILHVHKALIVCLDSNILSQFVLVELCEEAAIELRVDDIHLVTVQLAHDS